MATLSTQGQTTLSQLEQLSETDQRQVVLSALEANPGWLPPAKDKAKLWMALILGVLGVAIVAIAAGVVLAVTGQGPLSAAAWPIASAALAGLLGLFAKSPTS